MIMKQKPMKKAKNVMSHPFCVLLLHNSPKVKGVPTNHKRTRKYQEIETLHQDYDAMLMKIFKCKMMMIRVNSQKGKAKEISREMAMVCSTCSSLLEQISQYFATNKTR